ncbi:NYN domain-containing protein [Candidatus Gottesmanbacteria bacterium]|nr:NYN domain-containing protein [Candidatus Gottesmanbacteria bacterium]MBI5465277.1 NYN domain-containing protein [Candidatus Gottesmanbacteria bacterium]
MGRKTKRRKDKSLETEERQIVREFISQLEGRVAVYIDAANLEKSVKELGLTPPSFKKGMRWRASAKRWTVDYLKLKRFFAKNSDLRGISFYSARFGTPDHDAFLTFLKNNGYRPVTKEIKTIPEYKATISRKCKYCGMRNEVSIKFRCVKCQKDNDVPIERKADFDVEISVDAVDWINNYDTLVLFSGDSDFVYLTKYLKRRGKQIVVLSRRGHVADELRKSKDVDYYQDIFKLRKEFLKFNP